MERNIFSDKVKITLKIVLFIGLFCSSLTSCLKKYITGGQITDVNQYKNKTTYDVLNSLPQFDTLVQLIDAAGLKDKINQSNSTFFAEQNFSVYAYLNARTITIQNTVNQFGKFTLDSLLYYVKNNINHTQDSLLMYLIPNLESTPSNLTTGGNFYKTSMQNDSVIISYEITSIDASSIVSTPPRVVYFTKLWKHYNLSSDSTVNIIPETTGTHTIATTSFINTSNGVINVLSATEPLFFYDSNPK